MNQSSVLEKLANQLDDAGTGDPSQDLLVHLALAYRAYKQLVQQEGADRIKMSGRSLIKNSIERAFREAHYIRVHVLDPEELDASILTRYGFRSSNGNE